MGYLPSETVIFIDKLTNKIFIGCSRIYIRFIDKARLGATQLACNVKCMYDIR